MMKILFFLLASISFSAAAAPVCFSDKASYDQVKSSLPASMQKGSLYIIHDDPDSSLLAAVMITSSAKGFSFQMAYDHSLLGKTSEGGTIKKVCVNGNKVEVTLASGAKKTLTGAGSGFSYKGYILKNTTRSSYDKVYASIMGGGEKGSTGKNKGKT